MIWQVILFVTAQCNLRCFSCFYKENLNKQGELTFDELKTLISKLPRLHNIILTGGEPFLRDDLCEILHLIKTRQADMGISLNTNGAFPKKVERVVKKILENNGRLSLNISLDGNQQTHNKMRGRDIYYRVMETLERVTGLKKRYPSLHFTINSLLCSETLEGMPELLKINRRGVPLDFHNVEIRRMDNHLNSKISDIALKRFYRHYLEYIHSDYLDHYEVNRARLGLQYANYVSGADWGYPCNAGRKAVVIYHDGKLAPCEMFEGEIDLRNWDFDLSAALDSPTMKKSVQEIITSECFCTHGCWLVTSMFDYLENVYGELDFSKIPENSNRRVLVPTTGS